MMTGQEQERLHKFEAAGLGKAPFKVVGFFEAKHCPAPGVVVPGEDCDYCGTALINVFVIRSADGKEFNVGCDCVEKTGDAGLTKQLKNDPEYNRIQEEKRRAKAEAKRAELKQLIDEHFTDLRGKPHPYLWMAKKGYSLFDYANYMEQNAGNKGRTEAVKAIREALGLK